MPESRSAPRGRSPRITITPAGVFRDYYATGLKEVEHGRGIAWSATLWRGDLKIGLVSNEGTGGANRYDMPRPVYLQLVADATAWAGANGLAEDDEESLVATFANEAIEYGKYREIAKKNAKRGKPITVIFLDEPEWLGGEDEATRGTRPPDVYNSIQTLGVMTPAQAEAALAKYRPVASFVLTVATA